GILSYSNTNESKAENLTFSDGSSSSFSGTISVNSITASGGGQNTIKVDSSTLEHVGFDSLGQRVGANTIGSIAANGGNNTIEIKGTSTIGSITTSGGKNTITLDGTSTQRSITQEISSTGGVNVIILKGTDANLITLESTLSASGSNAKNAIGSVDLSGIAHNGFSFGDSTRTGIASQAFQGTLEIKSGIKGTDGGWNNIAFKATSLQTQSVISAREEGTAISGNTNLYLDVSEAGFGTVGSSPSSKPAISGNVVLGSGETANLYIKGKSSQAELYSASSITTQTIGLDGNLENTSGNMNLIFEDALWNPYGMITGVDLATSETSGKVTNKGGNVNIVFRKSDTSLALPSSLDQTPSLPAFKVINESGKINIIMQGQTAVSSYITYGSDSTTNLIFANTSSGTDSFASTEATTNKILGKTYQDGVKLSLQDKQIAIGDSQSASFIDTYKQYFANTTINEKDSLLNITTTRSKSGTTQTDQIYVKGLAVGDISELAPSQQKDGVSYIYNVVLGKDSAFVGNIALQADSKVNLIMEQGSKLLTDSKDLKIQNLAINGDNFDRSEILKGTFEQKNTIIDIASMGSDLGQLKSRSEFRLLTIGTKEANAGILASGVKTTGLTGSSALFRVYMNNKSGDGSLGGSASYSDKQYGYVYSDRILVLSGSHQNSKEETQPH
ncbi:hypothetical protein, partial [Helicobacter kayseriensis]|uniref:hypothetical protein n=1 Tax=Helicobacter kayseriensis TaxID=2905877 RepID=UPI001E2FB2BC